MLPDRPWSRSGSGERRLPQSETIEQILRETAQPFSGQMTSIAEMLADEEAPQPLATPNPAATVLDATTGGQDACILQENSNQTPNDLVGYGIVDDYAAVQRALALSR